MSRWTVAVAALSLTLAARAQGQEPLELTIMQYQPPTNPAEQEYYMGRVRETAELVEARGQGNVLLVNTGGATLTREDATKYSMVTPAATALSLADFDKGLNGEGGLISRLTASGERFVAANLKSPQLHGLVSNSVVTKFGDYKVGIVGYVSPYLNVLLDDDDGSNIVSEVMAVKAEVTKLQTQGAHIIIAMGNAGHEANKELAKMVPGVDVVVAAPTDMAGADFPQMMSQPWHSRGVPVLEIPNRGGNMIGVTRLLFNARGEMKRGVGLYDAVKEGVTDTLAEETIQIMQLQPEQNEVTGHSAADNKIESDVPAVPTPAPFRPRPAVASAESAPTGEVLATVDGVISGLGSDCETMECAMGKLIADAIKWRLGGRINAAVVGSGAFSGSWQGEIRESDVANSLAEVGIVYMGRLHGGAQLKQLFMQASMGNTEFLHPSGVTMNLDPLTHAVSDLMVDCSTCVPSGLRMPDSDMPYTVSFVTGANTKPSVFQEVRDTGLSLKDDVVIPYLRRNKALQSPDTSRITMKAGAADTDSRVSQVLNAAEAPAAPAPVRAQVPAPAQAPVQVAAQIPAHVMAQAPAQAAPQMFAHGVVPSHEEMMQYMPPPPSAGENDMLAYHQATTAYQQAVLAAVQQAAGGHSDQHYTSEQQMALAELYNSLAGRPTSDGVVVQRPVALHSQNGQYVQAGQAGQYVQAGQAGQYVQAGQAGQAGQVVQAGHPGQAGIPVKVLGAGGEVYAEPEAEGSSGPLSAWLESLTGGGQDEEGAQAGTDGVSSFLPAWLTASSDTETPAAGAAAEGSEEGGISSVLPPWLGGKTHKKPVAAAAAGAAYPAGAATHVVADESEEEGGSMSGAWRYVLGVPAGLLATSMALGAVL